MKTFLITDTHFFHENLTTKFKERPEGFTELVLENWIDALSDWDVTIHLGDVNIGQDSKIAEMLYRVPGRKILVRGNHDHKSSHWYLTNGFDFVCDSFTIDAVLFTHKPKAVLPADIKLNVHGHLHGNNHRFEPWMKAEQYRELALENTNYKPVLLEDFIKP